MKGITFRRGCALERVGIRTYEDLLKADSRSIAHEISTSPARMERWKAHSAVVATQRPQAKRPLPINPARMLILDIEHTSRGSFIWLIGVRIIRDGRTEDHLLWTDKSGPDDQLKNLKHLRSIAEDNRDLPIVTWNGTSSDLRVLREWASGWRVRFRWPHQEIEDHHFDLYRFVRDNVRLPIGRLGPKDVARVFGVPHDVISARVPVTESEKRFPRLMKLSNMQLTPLEKRFGYKMLPEPLEGLKHLGYKRLLTPIDKVAFEDAAINGGGAAESAYKRYLSWARRPAEDRPPWMADLKEALIAKISRSSTKLPDGCMNLRRGRPYCRATPRCTRRTHAQTAVSLEVGDLLHNAGQRLS